MTWNLWVLASLAVLCFYVILRDSVWTVPARTREGENKEGTTNPKGDAVQTLFEPFDTDDRVWIDDATGVRAGGVLLGRMDPEEVPADQRRWMVFLDAPIKNERGLWRAVCVSQVSLTRLPRSAHAANHNTTTQQETGKPQTPVSPL